MIFCFKFKFIVISSINKSMANKSHTSSTNLSALSKLDITFITDMVQVCYHVMHLYCNACDWTSICWLKRPKPRIPLSIAILKSIWGELLNKHINILTTVMGKINGRNNGKTIWFLLLFHFWSVAKRYSLASIAFQCQFVLVMIHDIRDRFCLWEIWCHYIKLLFSSPDWKKLHYAQCKVQ